MLPQGKIDAECLRKIIAFCGFEVLPERFPVILERCRFGFMKQHENQFDPAMEWLWERGVRLNGFLRAGRVESLCVRRSTPCAAVRGRRPAGTAAC